MTLKTLSKIKTIAYCMCVFDVFVGFCFLDSYSMKPSAYFFVAAILFAGSGYFAENLISHYKMKQWRRKRQARIAMEQLS